MRVEKPIVVEDGLYNQKQAAVLLDVDRHTVARYEADGLIKFKIRKAGKAKVTTGAEIIKCWNGMYSIK